MSLNPEVDSAYKTILELVRRDHSGYSARKQRRMADKLTKEFLRETGAGVKPMVDVKKIVAEGR